MCITPSMFTELRSNLNMATNDLRTCTNVEAKTWDELCTAVKLLGQQCMDIASVLNPQRLLDIKPCTSLETCASPTISSSRTRTPSRLRISSTTNSNTPKDMQPSPSTPDIESSSTDEVTLTMCTQCERILSAEGAASLRLSGDEDDSVWVPLSEYLAKETRSIVFSHGLCANCFRTVSEDMDIHSSPLSTSLGAPSVKAISTTKSPSLSSSFDSVYSLRSKRMHSPLRRNHEHNVCHYARVLVVDDNRLQRKIIQRMVTHAGYKCDVASNGRDALKLVQENMYSLVLMDCIMDEDDGWSTTAKIRKFLEERGDNGKHTTTIYALTGLQQDNELRQQCAQAGMDGVISKPVTQPVLRKILFSSTLTTKNKHIEHPFTTR